MISKKISLIFSQLKNVALDRFEKEVRLLRQLRHDCIVAFVGASHVPGKLMICTELLVKGSVSALLERTSEAKTKLPYLLQLRFAVDMAKALAFLHNNRILYRDMKVIYDSF